MKQTQARQAYRKQYYLDNIERFRKQSREYYSKHRDFYQAKSKRRYRLVESKNHMSMAEYNKMKVKPLHKWTLTHPDKKRVARQLLNCAIQRKRIIKPKACESCSKRTTMIHGHHHKGYKKWWVVQWLCAKCHKEKHV